MERAHPPKAEIPVRADFGVRRGSRRTTGSPLSKQLLFERGGLNAGESTWTWGAPVQDHCKTVNSDQNKRPSRLRWSL